MPLFTTFPRLEKDFYTNMFYCNVQVINTRNQGFRMGIVVGNANLIDKSVRSAAFPISGQVPCCKRGIVCGRQLSDCVYGEDERMTRLLKHAMSMYISDSWLERAVFAYVYTEKIAPYDDALEQCRLYILGTP